MKRSQKEAKAEADLLQALRDVSQLLAREAIAKDEKVVA